MNKSLRITIGFAMSKWDAIADSGFAISTSDLEKMTIVPMNSGL